jgi:hypothetical protein
MQQWNRCFLKDPLKFFWECGHPKVDATAQQALLDGPEEYSRGRSGCESRCNSGTGVSEKTPSFFLDFGHLKVDATAQQAFFRRTHRIFLEEILDVQVDATAQQTFSRRTPPN